MPNTTYSTALSVTTIDNFSDKIFDLTLGQVKFLKFLDRLGFVKRIQGGANITERIMYQQFSNINSISAYETIDLSPQEPFTAAVYAWKIIAGAISFSNLLAFQNSNSKVQISNVVTDLIMAGMSSFKLTLDSQAHGDGTGNGSKDIGGLDHLIAQGSWGTVGGINSSTDTWWRNQDNSSIGSAAANLIDEMADSRIAAERNGCSVGLVLTEANGVAAYEKAAVQLKRFVKENSLAADMGIPNIDYAGSPVINSPSVTSGEMFMLCPDTFRFVIGRDVKPGPMVSPVDQDVKASLMVFYGNMVSKDRSSNAVLRGITYP